MRTVFLQICSFCPGAAPDVYRVVPFAGINRGTHAKQTMLTRCFFGILHSHRL